MKKSLIKYFIFFLLLVVLIFTISSTMAASDNSASNSKSIKNFIDKIINNIKGSIQGSFISNLFDNDGVKNDNVFVPLATETFPNEPAGFTRIAEFSPTILPPKSPPPNEASLAGCWLSGRSGQTGGPYIVSTPSPVTGNSALKFVYGSGLTEATQDPGGISGWQSCSQHEQYPEIYESGYFRVGEENQKTFEMLTFGFKALGYWGAGAVGDVCECQVYNVISAQQPTPGQVSSFWFNLYNQGGGSDGKAYSSNAGDGTITVGQWYRYEIYMKINDIGQANGIMTAWLNGKKVLDYNTVQFRNSVHNRMFFGRELDPIYGGRIPSGSKTQTDNLYFDRIYISARGFGTPPPITTSAPIVSLSASPTSINTGQSSTLAWSSTGATSCTASGGTFTGTKALSSSQSVLPTTNTTYTLTCIGAGGSTSKSTMVTVSQQAPTETGNLPVNPSFETGTAGNADTWTESSSHTRSSDRARTGAYSLKSTFRSSGGSGVATDQTLNVFPNTNYTYSGWIYKAATSGSAYLDMNDILGELQLYTSLTNTWQKVSGTWNSGTNTNVKLRLVTDGSMNGDVWFDDIELIPGGVTPPPPPLVTSGSYLNEPLGFERLAEINFSSLPGKTGSWDRAENQLAGSWYRRPYDVHTIIASDSSAPQSPQGILRARFPAGLVGGESSVFFGGASSDQQPQRELYVSVQMRIEGSDYQNQKVFTKLWYLPYMNRNRNNHATLGLLGNGTQEAIRSAFPLVYSLSEVDSLTGTDPGHSTPRYQNRGKRQFTVGPWHQIEMYLKQNTFGATPNPDGVLLIWLDGELVMDYRDIRWSSAQNPLGFYEFHADMIYGGVGGIRTRDDYIDFDHIYISGSSASTLPPSTTDTTPPIVTITSPTANQQLNAGTISTTLSVTTNEAATCRYSNSNQAYDNMANTFTTTGSTAHTIILTGLANGQSYTYYVRCADASGNKNTASSTIIFSVASVVPVCGDNICNGNENSASCPVDCSLICDITSASWSKNNSVEGDVVYLNVFGNNCNGKTVSFDVKEKDFASDLLGGDDPINANPLNVVFNGASASGTWVSEWQDDGLAGTAGDPEYYFTATVVGTNEQMQSGTNDFEMLHVTQKKSLPANPKTPQLSIQNQNDVNSNVLVTWAPVDNAMSYRYSSGLNTPANALSTPAPIVTLTASPTSINAGQSSTLTWSSTGATSCTASGGTFTGTKALSSSQSVSPTASTTYTLTCTGSGGSTSKSTTVTVGSASTSVVTYPAPSGLVASTEYSVAVNGKPVFVYNAQLANNHHFAYFDFNGTVQVTIQTTSSIQSVAIRPKSSGIVPTVSGNTISFTLSQPENLVVEVNGNLNLPLLLFANPLEINPPKQGDPNVIYFGPGKSSPGTINVNSGQTVYIAGGAWVDGIIRAVNTTGITVRGRGVLNPQSIESGQGYVPGLVGILRSQDVLLEGIIVYGKVRLAYGEMGISLSNNVNVDNMKVFGGYWLTGGDDGIVVQDSQNINIRNSFVRTNDDSIVYRFDGNYIYSAGNYIVENSVLWPNGASGLVIAAETLTKTINNVVWRNSDVIHQGSHRWNDWWAVAAVSVHPVDITSISNMRLENIGVEDSRSVIQFVLLESPDPSWVHNPWSNPGAGGIQGILVKNMRVYDSADVESVIKGWDSTRRVTNITFENLTIEGRLALNASSAGINVDGSTTGNIQFVSSITPPPSSTITCPTTVPANTFQACYYDNKDFTSFKLTRTESLINFDWGLGSPDSTIGADTFSAKWEGDFTFENAIYNFSAIVDDGVRLYIDNNILIDKWLDQAPTTYTATKAMTPGTHRVKVEYYENGIGATAKVSWNKQTTLLPPPPPPPTTISRPNEPSGFTRIIENNFNLIPSGTNGIAGSWWSDSNVRIVSDNSAPVSSPNVLQFKFPTGLRAGDGGNGQFSAWDSSKSEYKEIYESTWVKIPSPDFETQLVGVKLLGYWGVGQKYSNPGGVPNQIFNLIPGNYESTSIKSSWQINMHQQNQLNRNLYQNRNNWKLLEANKWARFEFYMKLNDIGSKNGILRVWLDGTLILEYTDVEWRTVTASSGFYGRQWDPIWGGGGGTAKTRDDYLYVDHIYISGVPMSGSGSTPPPTTPAPIVTLTASPTSINAGQSSTLTWSSTSATSCTASGGTFTGTKAFSSSQSVSPTASTTYTLTCTGNGGSTSKSTMVTINQQTPPPSGNLYPNKPANYNNIVIDYAFSDSYVSVGTGSHSIGGGWSLEYDRNTVSSATDAVAPVSPSAVLQWKYLSGGSSGSGVGEISHGLPSASQVYIAFAVKHGTNFEFNSISNKFLYLEPGNIMVESKCFGQWWSVWRGDCYNPIVNTPITVGQWEIVEVLADAAADNIKVWVNDQLRTDQSISLAGGWNQIKLSSVWGGSTGPRTRDSYRWVDHIYVVTPGGTAPLSTSSSSSSQISITGLAIESSWKGQNNVTSDTSVILPNVPNNSSIFFCVWGVNSVGESVDNACNSYVVGSTQPPSGDTTPPIATIISPIENQQLAIGTTQTTLSVTTNEAATCKYDAIDRDFNAMIYTLNGAGTTSHTTAITNLQNGTNYIKYVRCQDASGNKNTASSTISFTVAGLIPVCGDGICNGNENSQSCVKDCSASVCGDNICNATETISSCSVDCPLFCDLTSASWSTNKSIEGEIVYFDVTGNNCNLKTISFEVKEYDIIGNDAAKINPLNVIFQGNSVTGSWIAEWQSEGAGESEPPEYYFTASVVGGNEQISSRTGASELLSVNKLGSEITQVPTSSGGGGSGGSRIIPGLTKDSVSTKPSIAQTRNLQKANLETINIVKDFSQEIGIKQIEINVVNEAQNVDITVSKYDSRPATVSVQKSGKTYKYLQIETENLGTNLESAKITFQVEKRWAEENNLKKENIALFKFLPNENKWSQLLTTFTLEDNEFYYYKTELNSFSYFVIGEKEVYLEQPSETATEPETQNALKDILLKKITKLVIVLLILIIIVVISLIFIIRSRRAAEFRQRRLREELR